MAAAAAAGGASAQPVYYRFYMCCGHRETQGWTSVTGADTTKDVQDFIQATLSFNNTEMLEVQLMVELLEREGRPFNVSSAAIPDVYITLYPYDKAKLFFNDVEYNG